MIRAAVSLGSQAQKRPHAYWAQKAPVIMKSNMPLDEARRYAGAVHRAGGMVRIKEEGQNENEEACPSKKIIALENFIMCPRCGYKQLKEPSCKRCGLPFDRV